MTSENTTSILKKIEEAVNKSTSMKITKRTIGLGKKLLYKAGEADEMASLMSVPAFSGFIGISIFHYQSIKILLV